MDCWFWNCASFRMIFVFFVVYLQQLKALFQGCPNNGLATLLPEKSVMLFGSPPKALMLFLIHFRASTWSINPAFPGASYNAVVTKKVWISKFQHQIKLLEHISHFIKTHLVQYVPGYLGRGIPVKRPCIVWRPPPPCSASPGSSGRTAPAWTFRRRTTRRISKPRLGSTSKKKHS